LATAAEANAKADATRAVTPAALLGFARVASVDFGDGTASSFILTPGLGNTQKVQTRIFRKTGATLVEEEAEVVNNADFTVTISGNWVTIPAANGMTAVFVG
jgi:hypothetical protein